MDTFWIEFLKQAPGIAAVIFLVIIFLRFIRESTTDMLKTFKEIRDSCHDFHGGIAKSTEQVIVKNGISLDNNNVALGKVSAIIERFQAKRESVN